MKRAGLNPLLELTMLDRPISQVIQHLQKKWAEATGTNPIQLHLSAMGIYALQGWTMHDETMLSEIRRHLDPTQVMSLDYGWAIPGTTSTSRPVPTPIPPSSRPVITTSLLEHSTDGFGTRPRVAPASDYFLQFEHSNQSEGFRPGRAYVSPQPQQPRLFSHITSPKRKLFQ
jgi:hypothetical protein